MKYKHLACIFAMVTAMNGVVLAEESVTPATATAAPSAEEPKLETFHASLRMERIEFVKKTMNLKPDQEKKFMDVFYFYETELKLLNEKRAAIIKDYSKEIDSMTDAKADKLVKQSIQFRKQRTALLEKYYPKIAKATSKVIAARFLQVESFLQGAGDVLIGSELPLMPK